LPPKRTANVPGAIPVFAAIACFSTATVTSYCPLQPSLSCLQRSARRVGWASPKEWMEVSLNFEAGGRCPGPKTSEPTNATSKQCYLSATRNDNEFITVIVCSLIQPDSDRASVTVAEKSLPGPCLRRFSQTLSRESAAHLAFGRFFLSHLERISIDYVPGVMGNPPDNNSEREIGNRLIASIRGQAFR
jgi:hypothetical protein